MVRFTGAKLTKAQIYGCIRHVDVEGNGVIDVAKLENALKVRGFSLFSLLSHTLSLTLSHFFPLSPPMWHLLKETAMMGVDGSPWKMYVDPAEDVLCYHNFKTNEKIFDYQMTDKKLREITIAG